MNDIAGLIFRWLHIIPAIVMFGGVIFMRCCLVSANSDSSIFDKNEATRKRWGKLVMICTLLLLVSGLYNAAMKAIGYELSMVYNAMLGLKILLALVVFFFVAVHSGRSERAVKLREREAHWLNVLIALMLVIVLMAGYMKTVSTGFDKKVKKEDQSSRLVAPENRSSFPNILD